MWAIFTQESSEGVGEACSKWIFLVCNEATSSSACGAFGGVGRKEGQQSEQIEE